MDAAINNTRTTFEPTLVIRANAFTSKIDDGYVMRNGRKVSAVLSVTEIAAYLAANPTTRVDFLRT